MQQIRYRRVTIAAGAALSDASGALGNEQLVGVILPANWDAAALSFQNAIGATFGDVFTASGELNFPAASTGAGASRTLLFDTDLVKGLSNIKVRSGLTAAAVNQTAERVITLLTRGE